MRLDETIKRRFSELAEAGKPAVRLIDEFFVDKAIFHRWATAVLSLLARACGEESVHFTNFSEKYRVFKGYGEEARSCLGIFEAAREDYEGGYLFTVRSLVKSEILTGDVLEQAVELLGAGYKDPACVLAGVALESSLKELCLRCGIPEGKMDRMNVDLCKAGTYNMAKQKQITAWTDLRNKGAHGEFNEYDMNQVSSLVEGVQQFIADFL
ncbi:MAG TPA: DUF4145 domain-containing protein [Acidobacteriota bacterium]|nr:DUF4145 domain-containing protein [Acidobacteriota bacterium]